VDVVKMDWCNTEGMKPEDTYPLMSEALNKTGRPIQFNLCEWGVDAPWKWAPQIAQSWRATGDHTGTWSSTKGIIAQRTAIPEKYGGAPWAWNDLDMLETGNYKQAAHANGQEGNMTATEYKTEFSMWAIFASPLIVTTPLLNCSTGVCHPSITPLQQEILFNTEITAINQEVTPAGRLLHPSKFSDAGVKVFGRMLSDGSAAFALLNEADEAADAFVDFTLLGMEADHKVLVRDLWEHEDLGEFEGRFPKHPSSITVEPHATRVLRLKPVGAAVAIII